MDLSAQLKLLGLTSSETTVYLFLLQNGLSTPPIVSRQTKIARTNCYNILSALLAKGLIIEQIANNKRKAYLASDPQSFVNLVEQKRELALRTLPDLYGLYTTNKHRPKVLFFDGLENVKEIYTLCLSTQMILGAGASLISSFDKPFYDNFEREIVRRGVVFNRIDVPTLQTDESVDVLLLFGDSVAFITLTEPIFGTVIQSKQIAGLFSGLLRNSPNVIPAKSGDPVSGQL